MQPIYGQFANVFGRRYPSLFAVAIFTLGSGISGGSKSIAMLIVGRVVQGIGGGGISVMTELIVSDLVSVRERGTYIGIVFAVFGLGTMVGPVIGGQIVQYISWRWVFYLNLPVGGIALALQYFFLQVTYKKIEGFSSKARKIDWLGNILLVGSVVSILIALTWANTKYSWSAWQVLVPLLVGFAGTILFHAFEASKWCIEPTIPGRLFTNRTCAVAMILTFAQSMLTFWWIYFLPVYFVSVQKVSTGRSGVLLLPSVTSGVLTALVSGYIVTRTGRYKLLHLAGFALMTVASGLFTLLNSSSSLVAIVMFQVVAAFGVGCVMTTLLPAAQADLPQALVSSITSTWGFMRSYGTIWGIAIPAAIFNSRFEQIRYRILDPTVKASLGAGKAYSHASNTGIEALPATSQTQVISVYSDSLKQVWQVAVAFAGFCFLLAFVEKEVELSQIVSTEFGLKERVKKDIEHSRESHSEGASSAATAKKDVEQDKEDSSNNASSSSEKAKIDIEQSKENSSDKATSFKNGRRDIEQGEEDSLEGASSEDKVNNDIEQSKDDFSDSSSFYSTVMNEEGSEE